MYTAGEAIVRMAALELECVARAALVARPLTPPGGVRSAICRIAESSVATAVDLGGKGGGAPPAKRPKAAP